MMKTVSYRDLEAMPRREVRLRQASDGDVLQMEDGNLYVARRLNGTLQAFMADVKVKHYATVDTRRVAHVWRRSDCPTEPYTIVG